MFAELPSGVLGLYGTTCDYGNHTLVIDAQFLGLCWFILPISLKQRCGAEMPACCAGRGCGYVAGEAVVAVDPHFPGASPSPLSKSPSWRTDVGLGESEARLGKTCMGGLV